MNRTSVVPFTLALALALAVHGAPAHAEGCVQRAGSRHGTTFEKLNSRAKGDRGFTMGAAATGVLARTYA